MKYRKLRIAWSVGCGIVCLLLIALWAQAETYDFEFRFPINDSTCISMHTIPGRYRVCCFDDVLHTAYWDRESRFASSEEEIERENRYYPTWRWMSLGQAFHNYREIVLPAWLPVITIAVFGVLPWWRWRFSLRTLLIAMTLLAVVLGALVISMR
jgi:4-amino-4-deoxy-L-arabinose transferase-like glycosyltransferase